METDILAVNSLVITTLCPIHIGTGEKLKHFDFVREGDAATVIDEKKLFAWAASDLTGRQAESLTQLAENNQPIRDLLNANKLSLGQVAAYQIKVNTRQPLRDVSVFIKDASYQPFMPGSSVKGSLRSALLRGATLEDAELRGQFNQMTLDAAQRRSSASKDIEADLFTPANVVRAKRSNYDLNRVLALSDSIPREINDLRVEEVKILTTRGDKLDFKGFGIFVEAVREKCTFRMRATWLKYLLNDNGPASRLRFQDVERLMIYLPEFCLQASLNILEQEIAFYHRHGHPALAGWFEDKRDRVSNNTKGIFIFPIGWGSGYDAKTITDLLDNATFKAVSDHCRNTKGLGRPGNNPRNDWLGPDLSPKSRKVVVRSDDEMLPIGWVSAVFRPAADVEEDSDWFTQTRLEHKTSKPSFLSTVVSSEAEKQISTPKKETGGRKTSPTESPKPPARPAPPKPLETPTRKIIAQFDKVPEAGDRFWGEIFEVQGRDLYLLIPGLDDTIAYAFIPAAKNTTGKRYKEGARVLCVVDELRREANKTIQVRCGIE